MALEPPNPGEQGSAYECLLLEYASGCLDEAHSLIVASHLALSPAARDLVAYYESVGGSILRECCNPAAMKPGALDRVLDRLEALPPQTDSRCAAQQKAPCTVKDVDIPSCLQKYISGADWNPCPSGHVFLRIGTSCQSSQARLVRIKPGNIFGAARRFPRRIALVLDGECRERESIYGRGDLIVMERAALLPLKADEKRGAVFFVVEPAPVSIQGLIGQTLMRFLRG